MTGRADETVATASAEARFRRLRYRPDSAFRTVSGSPDPHVLARSGDGPRTADGALTAAWHATWDSLGLNVQALVSAAGVPVADGDTLDLFLAAEPDEPGYGPQDYHLVLGPEGTVWTGGNSAHDVADLTVVSRTEEDAWHLAVAVPWSMLDREPTVGQRLGFDVHYHDSHEGTIAWGSDPAAVSRDASRLPVVELAEE